MDGNIHIGLILCGFFLVPFLNEGLMCVFSKVIKEEAIFHSTDNSLLINMYIPKLSTYNTF